MASLGPVVELLSRPGRPPRFLLDGSHPVAASRLEVMLDDSGDRRFLARSHGFDLELRSGQAEQVLYSSFLEALGYVVNRQAFRRLAEAVPISLLRALVSAPAGTRLLARGGLEIEVRGVPDGSRG